MLSTLVKRQKIWTIPLLISLVFSWCLLFCQSQAMASASMATQNIEAKAVEGMSVDVMLAAPCHSMATATDTADTSPHADVCSACSEQAAATEPLQLATMAILVSWQGWFDANLSRAQLSHFVFFATPPEPGGPLYLTKQQFLI